MTNEELIKAIRENGNHDNRLLMELWGQNKGLIGKACGKYSGRLEEEDAKQECFIAFMDAVKEYDPEKGAAFSTYLHSRCIWHLGRYAVDCGQIVRLPQRRRQAIGNYLQFTRQWYQVKGEQPTKRILQIYLGLSAEDIEQIRDDMQLLNICSIDEPLADDPEGGTLSDLVQDPEADAEAAAMNPLFIQERKKAIWAAVESLKPQESEAIRHCYQEGINCYQVSKLMGVTEKQVRARIASGFRKLRRPKHYKVLREFVDLSRTYSMGIQSGMASFNRSWTSSTEKTALFNMESEERWKREQRALDLKIKQYRRELEEYKRRKETRTQ